MKYHSMCMCIFVVAVCNSSLENLHCRFRELLLEFSACEDNSEVLLETLDPLLERLSLSPGQLKNDGWGLDVTQLCIRVQGEVR